MRRILRELDEGKRGRRRGGVPEERREERRRGRREIIPEGRAGGHVAKGALDDLLGLGEVLHLHLGEGCVAEPKVGAVEEVAKSALIEDTNTN